MCPVSLADQLAPISGAKENTAFYLGFSLGKTTSPAEFLSPNVLELASGGTTRWQERGGAVIIPK